MALNPLDKELLRACIGSNPAAARVALELGADPNVKNLSGCSPAMFAANRCARCLVLLAENGADLGALDPEGCTLAMIAAKNGQLECLAFLNERGADFSLLDHQGMSARGLALAESRPEAAAFIERALAERERASLAIGLAAPLATFEPRPVRM
jgi:ankyrin repeat protein